MKQWFESLRANKKFLPLSVLCTGVALLLAILVTLVGVIVSLVASDEEAPEIQGPDGDVAVVYLGDPIAYKSFVTATDNKGEVELSVDQSRVKSEKEGTYAVVYTATDKAGNTTEYTLRLMIKSRQYSETALMTLVAERAEKLGMNREMSKTELVRAIYDFVNSPSVSNAYKANIVFSDESNTPNQKEQSGIRRDWETDWVEEAARTLEMDSMKGDCYTYYAVSKAFFEYFGIENVGIQRAKTALDGTHFWSAVKVEEGWYYYDSTRLGGQFADKTKNACLITEEKLETYRTSQGEDGFYDFEKGAKFPSISEKELKK